MTTTCHGIGNLVLKVETPFLDMPGLTLTVDEARRYFDVDPRTCHAVLETLTEARVLTRTADGAYKRYFPKRRRTGVAA